MEELLEFLKDKFINTIAEDCYLVSFVNLNKQFINNKYEVLFIDTSKKGVYISIANFVNFIPNYYLVYTIEQFKEIRDEVMELQAGLWPKTVIQQETVDAAYFINPRLEYEDPIYRKEPLENELVKSILAKRFNKSKKEIEKDWPNLDKSITLENYIEKYYTGKPLTEQQKESAKRISKIFKNI